MKSTLSRPLLKPMMHNCTMHMSFFYLPEPSLAIPCRPPLLSPTVPSRRVRRTCGRFGAGPSAPGAPGSSPHRPGWLCGRCCRPAQTCVPELLRCRERRGSAAPTSRRRGSEAPPRRRRRWGRRGNCWRRLRHGRRGRRLGRRGRRLGRRRRRRRRLGRRRRRLGRRRRRYCLRLSEPSLKKFERET